MKFVKILPIEKTGYMVSLILVWIHDRFGHKYNTYSVIVALTGLPSYLLCIQKRYTYGKNLLATGYLVPKDISSTNRLYLYICS